jgi:transcriptional regulator with XRE-family HTH domain
MRIRLREARLRKVLTQEELAQRSGVAEATISRIESGQQEARISTVRKLAAALGLEPSELVNQEPTDTKRAA